MAWHLASLKFALLRGAIRRGGRGAIIGLAVTLIVGVGTSGVVALSLSTMRSIKPSTACDIAAVVFGLLLVFWTLGPVVALASDSTIDVDRLSLFPLTARQLMPGLLLAAAISVGGVFTAIVLLGAFVGLGHGTAAALTALVAIVLEFVLCLAVSRLVSTSLSAAASKRRWRDVALFVGPLIALAVNLGIQAANRAVFVTVGNGELRTHSHALAIARQVVRWLPTGWSTQAVHAAGSGNLAGAVAGLGATAALAVGATALWWRVIEVATTSAPTPGVTRRAGGTALIPRAASWLPRTALGAVVAKELRYVWRDPRRRAALLGVMFAGVLPLLIFRSLAASSARTSLIAVWPALNIGLNANAFGFDADRLWVDVAAGVSLVDELRARTLARLVTTLPIVAVLVLMLAALAGTAAGILPALGAVAAAVGVGTGFAAVLSVKMPFPMGDTGRGNAFGGGGPGENASAGFTALGAMALSALIVSPLIIFSLRLPVHSPAQAAIFVVGVAVGWVGWRVGLRAATGPRRPDSAALLARLTRA